MSDRPLIVNHLEGKVAGRFSGVASYKHFLHSLSVIDLSGTPDLKSLPGVSNEYSE